MKPSNLEKYIREKKKIYQTTLLLDWGWIEPVIREAYELGYEEGAADYLEEAKKAREIKDKVHLEWVGRKK